MHGFSIGCLFLFIYKVCCREETRKRDGKCMEREVDIYCHGIDSQTCVCLLLLNNNANIFFTMQFVWCVCVFLCVWLHDADISTHLFLIGAREVVL